MDIGLLGPLTVDDGGALPLGPRDRVVLSALAVRSGATLTAEQLSDALWGERPPPSAPKIVQGCVMRLRKTLGAEVIETTPSGYRLVVDDETLDTHRFERMVGRGREQAATGSTHRAVETLRNALALWRGRPFPDLDEWEPGRIEAARLSELWRAAEEGLLSARLDAGEHAEVAADAVAMVAEEPWRERRWAILALAQYRSGRQADALTSIRQARAKLGSQLGIDPGSELIGLEHAILQQDPALAAADESGSASAECPYKGLAPYATDDAETFFGRETEITDCLRRLDATPLLVLAGPSGSGKSSLLRAGLIPVLARRSGTALVVPGADPEGATAAALASEPGNPVLAIDQFEEAFILGADDRTLRRWMSDLAEYAGTRAPVLVTIRADHLAGMAIEPAFARLAENGLHLVTPLTGHALRAAIERPAELAGLRLEPGLVDLMLRDSDGEPGSLPLLSHALAETWRHREGRVLTVDGYRATGGIRGSVARSADRLYENLPHEQRPLLRWTLLRLVSSTPEGEPVRTRVALRTLAGDPERARVINLLVRARLATADETTVELAHESLARAWPRLRSWLDEDAAGQRVWRHLSTAAEEWDALDRPTSELYRGARLETALEWADAEGDAVPTLEREFLAASEALAASERHRIAAAARQQARQNRRLRGLLAGAAALLVISLAAGFVAVDSSLTARQERDAANAATQRAMHEALVNRSLALRATNRQVAALLAVEAYRQEPDALAHSALLSTFTASPGFMGYQPLPRDFSNGTLIPGTSTAVLALDGRDLRLIDLDTGEITGPFPPPPSNALSYSTLKVSADRQYVAQLVATEGGTWCGSTEAFAHHDARGCTSTAIYSLRTGERVFGPVTTPFGGGDVALNADGSLVAVTGGSNGDLVVYDVATGQLLGRLEGLPRPSDRTTSRDTGTVAFDAAGRLYLGSMAGPIRVIDPYPLNVIRTLPAPAMSSHNFLALTSAGNLVASGEDAIVSFDVVSGQRTWTVAPSDDEFYDICPFLGVAEALDRIYCGDYFGRIEERDLRTGQPTGVRLDPQLGSVGDLAVSADGRELLSFGAQRPVISRWRLTGGGPIARLVAAGKVLTDGYDDAGRFLVSQRLALDTPHESVAVWDPIGDHATTTLRHAGQGVWFGPDVVSPLWADGSTEIYDLTERRRVDVPQLPGDAAGLWRSPDGGTVLVAVAASDAWPTTFTIRAFDAATLEQVGSAVSVDAYDVVSVSAGGEPDRLVVTVGRLRRYVTFVFDAATGERLATGLTNTSATAVSANGVLVGASAGTITEYDLDTLEPTATFPSTRGEMSSLQFSADGSRLLATSRDQTVQVYDVASRIRLGDPIDTSSPELVEGWLRPDGDAIAVNVPTGVAVWNIRPQSLVEAACRLAGRNLTQTEWDTYLAEVSGYHETCPQFGRASEP